jgi:hypothetical protein
MTSQSLIGVSVPSEQTLLQSNMVPCEWERDRK